jgi:hypothetical protein
LESLQILTLDWRVLDRGENRIVWQEPDGDAVGVSFFPQPTQLPAESLSSLRDYFRQVALDSGGALVSVDVVDLRGIGALRNLMKMPHKPRGMTFLGSILVPFADFSWVVRVQCVERGTTGGREAGVMLHCTQKGQSFELSTVPNDWTRDPYDPARADSLMRNLADDEAYDVAFADSPAARARRLLDMLQKRIHFTDEVKASAGFALPPPDTR